MRLGASDLIAYALTIWKGFKWPPHLNILARALEAVERGELLRLIVAMPPRHGKSVLASTIFPTWYLGRRAGRSVIFATYSAELATEFGRRVRNLLLDQRHRGAFPGSVLSEASAAAHRFSTSDGGTYFAVGRGGGITGRGADLLLIDDPLKDAAEAWSPTIRGGLHEWYRSVAYTRLQPAGAVVIISTRWHEDDLAGWLLREHAQENWRVLSLPAIAERDEPFRKEGEALWPERYPLTALLPIRELLGTDAWAALYQQRPAAAEGAVFHREWWQRYRERPQQFEAIVFSADTAFKKTETADYSVVTIWGRRPEGYYLLSMWRERVEFPELKRTVALLASQWNPNAVLIEDKASGQSLIQELKRDSPIPVLPRKADIDKVARAKAVTPMIEGGTVYIPEHAPWLREFEDEMAAFPAAPHDDIVDSVVQALDYMRGVGGGSFMFERGVEPSSKVDEGRRDDEDEDGGGNLEDQWRRSF